MTIKQSLLIDDLRKEVTGITQVIKKGKVIDRFYSANREDYCIGSHHTDPPEDIEGRFILVMDKD